MSEAVSSNANFLEPTLKRAALVYWALLWRAILLQVVAGFLIGSIEGGILTIAGIPAFNIRPMALTTGLILIVPVSIYAVQLALRKRYGEFTIRLLPRVPKPSI
jgi:hypothetical protein